MTGEQLKKRITSIARDAERLARTVQAMRTAAMEQSCKEHQPLSVDAAERAEWLVCRLRHMIYETTPMRKQEYLLQAAEAHGISFHNHDGIFEITLPGISLAPVGRRPAEFLTAPLHAALDDYFRSHPLPRYRRCVVCYTIVFDKELPRRTFSGVNNSELKQVQDVAASYLLIDDSSKYIDVFHATKLGGCDAVQIAFMAPHRFPQWLREQYQNRGKSGA